MQRLKEILMREDERLNLRNVGFCFLVVVFLVAIAFGVGNMKFLFQSSPDEGVRQPVASESQ